MALTTHVTDRYGTTSDLLVGLTNHDDETANAINATRLAEAAQAAEADFPLFAQATYDDLDESHVNAGVVGVIAYLVEWSTKPGSADKHHDRFQDKLKAIRNVGPGKRISPSSSSRLQPSRPDTSGTDVRPDFDREQFEDFLPEAPKPTGGQ